MLTAGIYSLVGFEITPSTIVGMLTILGYSLYDTVVVFDKVQENTAQLLQTRRQTFAEGVNDAINQTIMRSINTTIIGVLPVAALLFVGVGLLGVGTLKDLALVLFVGMIVGRVLLDLPGRAVGGRHGRAQRRVPAPQPEDRQQALRLGRGREARSQ